MGLSNLSVADQGLNFRDDRRGDGNYRVPEKARSRRVEQKSRALIVNSNTVSAILSTPNAECEP